MGVTDGRDENGDDDMVAIDARQNVTITVTNVNEAPVVTGDATASFVENSSSAVASYAAADPERDTLTWSVDDTTNFWISDRGQLYFRSPPSYVGGSASYPATVAVSDGTLSGSLSVTVTVTDAEEDGVVTITPPRGWVDTQTQLGAALVDDDGDETLITWQWARSSNRSSWTDIAGATSITYIVTADDANQYLRVTATYEDRRSSGKMSSAALASRIDDVRPATNNAPEFTDTPPVMRIIGQGTSAGRAIGAPVRATDADSDDVLTYSLDGQDAGLFSIDPATGQLRTKDILDYDPQGENTFEVTVGVHDSFDQTYSSPSTTEDDTIDVTITVTAVAQRTSGGGGGVGGGFGPAPTAPKFVDGFRTQRPLAVTARPGDAVGDPVAATHPRNSDITYSLSGADAALFTVDEETGQVRLGQEVTLELGQTYTVNLTATDSSGTGAIIIVVIEVAEAAFHRYDLNRNGVIEKNEVLAAISDYFAGLIEKDEILELISRYFVA